MSSSFGTFGASFGNYGSGGGVLLPASPADILQWLKGTDGLTILDKVDVVNPQPEVRDVGCLSFDGSNDYVSLPSDPATAYDDDFVISGYIKIDSGATTTSTDRIIYSSTTGADRCSFYTGGTSADNYLYYGHYNDATFKGNRSFTTRILFDTWYKVEWTHIGGDHTQDVLKIDDVTKANKIGRAHV